MTATLRRGLKIGLAAAALGATALGVYAYALFEDAPQADPFARFKPSEEAARSALEAALCAWRRGVPAGKVPGHEGPAVQVVDTGRQPDQTLDRFVILGEAAGEGPRCFAVRVWLRNPDVEYRLRFVVYGCDPLWVYRYEDFEMMIRWECGREELIKATSSKKANE